MFVVLFVLCLDNDKCRLLFVALYAFVQSSTVHVNKYQLDHHVKNPTCLILLFVRAIKLYVNALVTAHMQIACRLSIIDRETAHA